jgi:hypothetical protein
VLQLLLPIGNIELPKCESQVRPLTSIDPALIVPAWLKALEISANRPTSVAVQQAVRKVTNDSPSLDGSIDLPFDSQLSYLEQQVLRLLSQATKHVKAHNLETARVCLEGILLRCEMAKPPENGDGAA